MINNKRTHISTSGSFVAVPEAFAAADEGLRNILKLEFKTVFSPEAKDPLNLETVFSPDRFLIDLAAVVPGSFQPEKVIEDCKLVQQVAARDPARLERLVGIFGGASIDVDEAAAIAKELGLTEADSVKAGGGLLGLLVVAAAALFASGCAHTKPSKKPDPKPNQQ